MISLFRHNFRVCGAWALGMALVFLFFGFAGEALHARQHQAELSSAPKHLRRK
jgi:hypothetical protein